MGVVETKSIVSTIMKQCEANEERKWREIQCELLCKPLEKYFPWASKEAIQYELLSNGLFQPHEWARGALLLKHEDIWDIVAQEYEILRRLWQGPKTDIYIVPITASNQHKNGIAYQHILFLFVADTLHVDELRALLAHEYHHICRLYYLEQTSHQLPLQDSLVIEGMAECAVEELYGVKWLSPWTKSYTLEKILPIWQSAFLPVLQLQDIEKHQPYLFGNDRNLPKWIGYCIGYWLVKSFQQKNALTSVELLQMPTEIIVADWLVKKSDLH